MRPPSPTVSEIRDSVSATRTVVPQALIDAGCFAVLARLADDLAHEIRNPLNSMVINLEVLKRRVEKGATEGALDRSAVLEHELHRLHQMVEALLVLLRKSKPASLPSNLSEALETVVELVALRARLGRVPFTHDSVPEQVYTPAPGDALRFAILALTEEAFNHARHSGGGVRLTCDLMPGEIVIGIVEETSGEAAVQLAGENFALEGSALAAALLEPSGGSVHWLQPDSSAGSTVQLRVPRSDFRIEN